MPETIETQRITEAYRDLLRTKADYFTAAEIAAEHRTTLETAKRQARIEGKITGKNETEREDSARQLFPELYAAVEKAETSERIEKFNLEYSQIEVEQIKLLLRAAELAARVSEIPY